MSAHIEHYQDKAGEWRWRVTAANGEIIGASSEGYKRPEDAKQNLRLLVHAGVDAIRPRSLQPGVYLDALNMLDDDAAEEICVAVENLLRAIDAAPVPKYVRDSIAEALVLFDAAAKAEMRGFLAAPATPPHLFAGRQSEPAKLADAVLDPLGIGRATEILRDGIAVAEALTGDTTDDD